MPRHKPTPHHPWRGHLAARIEARRLRHARGLATIVGALVDRQGGLVTGAQLVLQRFPDPAGVLVWDQAQEQKVLHVDSTTTVRYYVTGAWEQRLLALIEETPHA